MEGSEKYFRYIFLPFALSAMIAKKSLSTWILGYRARGNIFIGTIGADMRGFFDFAHHVESHHVL